MVRVIGCLTLLQKVIDVQYVIKIQVIRRIRKMLETLIISIIQIPMLFMPPLQMDTSYKDIQASSCKVTGCSTKEVDNVGSSK
jgi:hypothetical protein